VQLTLYHELLYTSARLVSAEELAEFAVGAVTLRRQVCRGRLLYMGMAATGFLLPLIWNRGLLGPTNVVIIFHRQAE
jgi:hypothetical protein